ncbi:hypothetical protein [Xanthobacter sp. ZOL 2024]
MVVRLFSCRGKLRDEESYGEHCELDFATLDLAVREMLRRSVGCSPLDFVRQHGYFQASWRESDRSERYWFGAGVQSEDVLNLISKYKTLNGDVI